jgi:hypothetical protein
MTGLFLRDSSRKFSWEFLAFLGLSLIPVILVWIFRFFPSQDPYAHLYTIRLLDWWWSDPNSFPALFEPVLRPVPNWFCQIFLWLGMKLVGLELAHKLFISCYLLLFPLAFRYNVTALKEVSPWKCWFVFPFVLNHYVFFGFYNYIFGFVFFLFLTGYLLRLPDRPAKRSWLVIGVWCTLLYFCHSIPAVFAGLAVLLKFRRVLWQERLGIVGSLLPLGLLILVFIVNSTESQKSWQPLKQTVQQLFYIGAFSPFSNTAEIIVVIWAVLIVTVFIVNIINKRWIKDENSFFFYTITFISFLLCFLAPNRFSGGDIIQYRLTLLPWLFMVLGLAVRQKGILIILIFVSLTVYAHQLSRFWTVAEASQTEYNAYQEVMSLVPDRAVVLNFNENTYGVDAEGHKLGGMTELYAHAHAVVALQDSLPILLNYYQGNWPNTPFPFKFKYPRNWTVQDAATLTPWEAKNRVRVDYLVIQGHITPELLLTWEEFFEPVAGAIAPKGFHILVRKK